METLPAPVATWKRGDRWGLDGLYYPAEEERTVPLSGAAIRLIFYLYSALRRLLYPTNELVYVAADQFIYYEPHNPNAKIAPDVWVCFGVPQEPERAVFRPWEEGATPSFVVEVSSKDSRTEDRVGKYALYQDVLGCREYLIYDEDWNELVLYRRYGERFALVEPGPDGRLYSEETGAFFEREPGLLVRVFGPDGQKVPTVDELGRETEMLERIRRRLEAEAMQAAERTAALQREVESARRRVAEESERAAQQGQRAEEERLRAEEERLRAEDERQRAAALGDENEQLRAELERLRAGRTG